jgi:hypothetical protein
VGVGGDQAASKEKPTLTARSRATNVITSNLSIFQSA